MMRAAKWVGFLAGVLALAAGPASSASLTEELGGEELIRAAKKEGRVVVYDSKILALGKIMEQNFAKRFPDIRVELVRLSGGALHRKVMTEHAAGKLAADVIDSSDRGLVRREMAAGLVADYAPPTDAKYPADSKIRGKVYPGAVYLYLIGYNTAVIKDPPKGWTDLLHPRFRGKVSLVPAEVGGTVWMAALFQYQVLGNNSDSYWRKLAAQKPRLFTSAAGVAKAMISGESPVGITQDVASLGDIKRGAPVRLVYPPEGVIRFVRNVYVPTTSKRPNAGKLYYNWLLSREGQEVWTKQVGGISARTDIEPPEGGPRQLKMWEPSEQDFVKLRDSYTKRWNVIFGYKP